MFISHKIRLIFCCFAVVMLSSCATWQPISKYGDRAQTVISPNYQYEKNQKIVVLPFVASGKDTEGYEHGTADKFILKVMELGLYTIVDKGMVESFYYEQGIKDGATLTKKQLELIKEELGVDLVFYGTVNYVYVPSKRYGDTSLGSYYSLKSESLKTVSTATGEVVIISFTSSSYCGSLSQEIVYSIKKKLGL